MFGSSNARYRLLYQSDGNVVLYDDGGNGAVWATGTGGVAGGHLLMQPDGNLVMYDAQGAARWASNTSGHAGAWVYLQPDGNLVIYDAAGAPAGLDERLAGHQRRLLRRADVRFVAEGEEVANRDLREGEQIGRRVELREEDLPVRSKQARHRAQDA